MVRKLLPDELDRRILSELERNARASNRAIARALGVSAPTVAQRIKRMEDVGLIRGYRVDTIVPGDGREPAPSNLACAKCKGPIHGPARTRQFHGRTFAFCCAVCEESYAERFKNLGAGARGLGAVVVVVGAMLAFGLGGASCLTMGECLLPGRTMAPTWWCPPGARWRDESEDALVGTPSGLARPWRPVGWVLPEPPRRSGEEGSPSNPGRLG